MSVVIRIIGAKPESEEYLAAERIKTVLEKEFKESVMGEIILHANATVFGQSVKDIDIMLMGVLKNYNLRLNFTTESGEIVDDIVSIGSFCTAIEVKSHGREGIYREGTEVWVKYSTGDKSVTTQSNDQKNSIQNFLKRTYGSTPYVTNIILFTGVTQFELKELLNVGRGVIPSNVIGNDFSAKDLFQVIVHQRSPRFRKDHYQFESTNDYWTPEQIETVFDQFTRAKDCCGELTRKRIEQITSKSIQNNTNNISFDKMTICRGRAGTGKTVALIRKAIQLVDEEDARVMILTYNKALVSDIKRLFALAELPDMFQPSCVEISTMDAFFYKLINKGLYDGTLSGEDYIKNSESLIDEMNQFLKDDETRKDLINLLKKDSYLNWNYCFVDEAQDWTEPERDVLIRLFGNNLLIADFVL